MPPDASHELDYLHDDDSFDALYDAEIRRVSRRFWTPLETSRRAATLLFETGARSVLDVGSGVGKFALVAGSLFPAMRLVGIEQRAHLVDVAEALRGRLGIDNVRFVVGNATEAPWATYDGLYFYNSFAENLFDPSDRLDDLTELSLPRFARDVQRTVTALSAAPVGTAMATFYGSSGRVPTSFELAHQEAQGEGWLRLWVKRAMAWDGAFFVEDGESILRHEARSTRA